MSLTILNVSYPFARVGRDAVGGAEQVLGAIDEELAHEGHRSVVIAPEGSATAGELVPIALPGGPIDRAARIRTYGDVRRAIAQVLLRYRVDVVHLHGIDFHSYAPQDGPDVAVTLHLPLDWYPREELLRAATRMHLQCVSESQIARCPEIGAAIEVIPNGVALDRLAPGRRKSTFAVALGRICPEKGFGDALRAAREARVGLLLAGAVFPFDEHRRHYETEVAPLLDAQRRFIGPVGWKRKSLLLAKARCLLVPSRAPETSSLAAMEALACGTPVVAYAAGALPSIVEHGRTGFIVHDVHEMAAAIRQCDELRADDCRRAAEERFSGEIMVRRYLALYRRLAAPRRTRTVVSLHAVGQLESLRREWTALCREDPHATPFQYPQWLIPWCRHLNSGLVAGAALRKTGALRAVALAIRENGTVRLLGDGVSDYLGIAAQSGADAREVLAPVLDGARAADFVHLPSGSALLSVPLGRTRDEACVAQDLCPVLSLAPFEGPSDHWKFFRYLQRRLERTGRLETADATSEALEPMLGDLFRLHAARWNGRGVLRGLESFHAEVALGFLREGMLRLTVLRLDGRAIAAVYAFATRGRTWFYLSGFDPRFEKLSPGTVAVGNAIDLAAAEGHGSFDFLRGAEPYKYWWGAKDTATFRRSLILV